MERKFLVGASLVVAGVALLFVSALADPIGLGNEGFGWKQTLGVVIGAGAAVVGLALIYIRRGQAKTLQPGTSIVEEKPPL